MIDTDDKDVRRLKAMAEQLGEYYDSVQIFVTKPNDQMGTESITYGCGNDFAIYGQVRAWVLQKEDRLKDGGGL